MERILGVASLLWTPSIPGNIWVVEEREEKPWKKPGDWSVPMETCVPGEPPHKALERLLHEEVHGISCDPRFEPTFLCEVDILGLALVQVYTWVVASVSQHAFAARGTEVVPIGWKAPSEILAHPHRVGVPEMLEVFQRKSIMCP